MAKRSKKSNKLSTSDQSSGGFGLSLGDLLQKQGLASEAPNATPAPSSEKDTEETSVTLPEDLSACGKLVVRHERKGRGGKTVTLVSGLDWPPAQQKLLARELGKALGCGAGIEGDRIVVQGEQVRRVHTWLQQKGAKQVVLASRPTS